MILLSIQGNKNSPNIKNVKESSFVFHDIKKNERRMTWMLVNPLMKKRDFICLYRKSEGLIIEPTDVILFEGILALYDSKVRDSFSMKLFVDEDSDVRLSRRVIRDVLELGRNFDITAQQYVKFVKPSFDDYILPVSLLHTSTLDFNLLISHTRSSDRRYLPMGEGTTVMSNSFYDPFFSDQKICRCHCSTW